MKLSTCRTSLFAFLLASGLVSTTEAAPVYRKALTIQGARVSGAPLADFPILVSIVDPNLRTVANGGRVASASGADLGFMLQSGGVRLDHEIEKYDGVTGTLVAWVRIPSLTAVNTTIFVYYGDPEVTCAQNTPGNVWDANFRYVYHLNETSGDPLDATTNGTVATRNPNGDPAAVETLNVPGEIGAALDLTTPPALPPAPFSVGPPATDTHVSIADGTLAANAAFTLEAWVKFDTVLGPGGFQGIVVKGRESGTNWIGLERVGSGVASFVWPCCGSGPDNVDGTTVLGAGTWYYVAATFDGTSQRALYLNGVAEASSATPFTYLANALPTRVGDDSNGNWLDGQVDEIRFSLNVARSAGWIQTTYNNANCPSTSTCGVPVNRFVVEGTEQVVPTNYRSIGTAPNYSVNTLTATNGSAVVTGAGTAWRTANRGRGDSIDIGGFVSTVLSLDSETQITMTSPYTGATGAGKAYTISRKFVDLASWEDCIDGGSSPCGPDPVIVSGNYINGDRREVGIAYKDSVFVDNILPVDDVLVMNGSSTGPFHTITLTADPGNRHNGVAGTGVIVDMQGVSSGNGIILSENYGTVEWMEVRNGLSLSDGIDVATAAAGNNRAVIRNNIIHNVGADGIQLHNADHEIDIYNNIVYRSGRGIRILDPLNATSRVRIFNNTVFASPLVSTAGIAGVAPVAGTPVTVSNNISISNAGGDFGVLGLDPASRNNLAGDTTATTHSPAGGGLNSVPLTGPGGINFGNTTPGSENLHLRAMPPLSAATDAGVNLSCFVKGDIDGLARVNPWEIGADDVLVATAVELQSFSVSAADSAVELTWTTATELQNLGFHVYRADAAEGPYTRITASLIPGLGSSPTGRSYAYQDGGLVNGRTYFYELEDVETSGATERHGPVSVTPGTNAPGGPCCGTPPPGPSDTSYGDPSLVVLREVERSPRHVVLELQTGGFTAAPAGDGRVRLAIPGFESASRPGEPSLPMRRIFVEAASGKRVRLTSVVASDTLRFPGLRPVSQGVPGIEASEEGTVLASEEKRREGRAFRELFPARSALLLGSVFQGETKKAEALLFPLRWDGSGLTLSRRLLVRLEFTGAEKRETSQGGSRGRRRVERPSHVPTGVIARMVVREKGLYRVDYEELFGTAQGGHPRRIPAWSMRLSRQGASVAFHVEPDAGGFGPGSSLYFLSEGSALNPYGDAVYELETHTSGLAMPVEEVTPGSGIVSEHIQDVRREENHYYQAGLLEAPDLWQWDVIVSPGSKSVSFPVDGLAASATSGRLSVVMQGASDFEGVLDHHVKASVNGRFVGETTWDGKKPTSLDVEIEAGVLHEGTNTLELEDVGDAGAEYSMVFLNRFSVSYPRRLVASQGTLEGRFAASGRADIEGAIASSFVLDTTDVPRWLVGARATRKGLGLPVQAGRSYLVTSTALRPEVKRTTPSSLRSPTNRADYLLLAPQAFLSAAEPLLALRESQGLVTRAVALEEVYEQFGHGETTPEAIKEFLEYAYHVWRAPSPHYVLLVGDASYDPKDYLQTGVKDWLPGFPLRTSYLWTVSDPAYASVNGEDLLPDVAMGRLPAGSRDEALRMVEKILSYENGGGRLDGPAVLVADNADSGGNFEADADEIASTVLAPRNPKKIYYSVEGANTRAKIEQAFDDGASLMSYVGHGGTAVWASENIFNYKDAQSLLPQTRQPLLMTMNCLNGFFQFPPLDSLSEALLKAEGKGVVAAFSPSGLSVNEPAHVFHKALLEEIVSGRHERIGDAILAAQERYAQTGAFPELLSIYHLLGDPALRIR